MEQASEILIYQTEDNETQIETRLQDESVWLTQQQMAKLFSKDKRTISEHIRNIFTEGELQEISVVRNFRTTATDGKKYNELSKVEKDFIEHLETTAKKLENKKTE